MTVKLHAFVARGPDKGTLLFPHRHADGMYVVSPSKFKCDYIFVSDEIRLLDHLEEGLKLRMSNPGAGLNAPRLINPENVFRPVKL